MPRRTAKQPTTTVRLLANIGGHHYGQHITYDQATARWLVDHGIAEYINQDQNDSSTQATPPQ